MPTAGRIIRLRSPCHQCSRSRAGARTGAGAATASVAASARTVAIRLSRRLSGGVRCSTEAGIRSTAGLSQRKPRAATLAVAEVALERRRLSLAQRAERVGGEVVATLRAALSLAAHGSTPDGPSIPIRSASVTLIFSRPRRMRPFTVPRGIPSISAISEWLKPPK